MENDTALKVYLGEFSLAEMSGMGLSGFAPYRLLSAYSTQEAAIMLCIPHSWFVRHFKSTDDQDMLALATENPLKIFEGQGKDPSRFRVTVPAWTPPPLRPALLCHLALHRWDEAPRSKVVASLEMGRSHPMRICRCGRVQIDGARGWETIR